MMFLSSFISSTSAATASTRVPIWSTFTSRRQTSATIEMTAPPNTVIIAPHTGEARNAAILYHQLSAGSRLNIEFYGLRCSGVHYYSLNRGRWEVHPDRRTRRIHQYGECGECLERKRRGIVILHVYG